MLPLQIFAMAIVHLRVKSLPYHYLLGGGALAPYVYARSRGRCHAQAVERVPSRAGVGVVQRQPGRRCGPAAIHLKLVDARAVDCGAAQTGHLYVAGLYAAGGYLDRLVGAYVSFVSGQHAEVVFIACGRNLHGVVGGVGRRVPEEAYGVDVVLAAEVYRYPLIVGELTTPACREVAVDGIARSEAVGLL